MNKSKCPGCYAATSWNYVQDRPNACDTCWPAYTAAMREWIADCYWSDLDDVDDLHIGEVLAGIQRHYDGGIAGFIRDESDARYLASTSAHLERWK